MKLLKAPQRLIVAADFKPDGSGLESLPTTKKKVLDLARSLEGADVIIKVNSALRAIGYSLIDDIHECGMSVFADLKLYDISETLKTDGEFLRMVQPDIITVSANAGVDGIVALRDLLPDCEILVVTVLTNLGEPYCDRIHSTSLSNVVCRYAQIAVDGKADGVISSAKEASMLRKVFGDKLSINTPAIRPQWAVVKGDDQNTKRVVTPFDAIMAGADRIVVGRPITQAQVPVEAALRTIEEIEKGLAELPRTVTA